MTIDLCDIRSVIRCNPSPDNEMFRSIVLRGLIALMDAVEAGPTGEAAVILPQVQKTFTQLNASYATFASLGLLDSTKKLRHFYVVNSTDVDIAISFDGGTSTMFTVAANSAEDYDLGNWTGAATTSLQIKELATGTIGTAYFGGSY